ncbi:aspartate--tRNA(Asn) ligase [Candidatus Bathyarchaeota archaeon]|nr:aspartate--tRNA(Asn) ligase [Candidatus Bathyarchaeota archaeon]
MELDNLEDWRKTHYTSEITPDMDGREVIIGGWVTKTKDLGGLTFFNLQDREGSCQVTAKDDNPDIPDEVRSLITELGTMWAVLVKGKVREEGRAPGGFEIIPIGIKVLNTTLQQLPLVEGQKAELDTRLNNRVLDLRLRKSQAIFKIQHEMLFGFRDYFNQNHFTEISTPKIIGSATEGGTELFPIIYFDQEAFLSQSAQLYKEQLSSVFENVYEIAFCYRAEKSHTKRHLCEILVLDLEMAFANMNDVLETFEEALVHTLERINKECQPELKGLQQKLFIPELPLPRYTYTEILDLLERKGKVSIEWGEDIDTEAYRKLDKILKGYYYITHWPTEQKPFYIMPSRKDPKVSESFDLQMGWLELASGGTRVHDKDILIKRLREKDLNPKSFEGHLKAFDFGMPPHAGLGFGIARFLTMITGASDIREAVLYPRTPDRLSP